VQQISEVTIVQTNAELAAGRQRELAIDADLKFIKESYSFLFRKTNQQVILKKLAFSSFNKKKLATTFYLIK
jgi:hypothetical protein